MIITTKALSMNTLNISVNKDIVMGGGLFDFPFKDVCDNYDKVQDYTLIHSVHCPRTPSMSSSKYEKSYTEQMERLNNMIVKKDSIIKTNCVLFLGTQVELEYMASKSQPG